MRWPEGRQFIPELKRRIVLPLVVVLVLFGMVACSGEPASNVTSLDASAAYFNRPVPGSSVTAAYMTLSNLSAEEKTLVAFSSAAADRVELHNHIHSDGQMQMRQVEQLRMSAGEVVEFAPGGYHLMLMGVIDDLAVAERVTVTLTMSDGKSVDVEFGARDLVSPTP